VVMIYITSDGNIGIFDAPCEAHNLVLKQMNGEFNLNQMLISDLNNLSCCGYLVIDLSCLTDDDDSLINAIVGIKSMYDFRIIILAVGYEAREPILGRLFAEGIYNIITAKRPLQQTDEIDKCLADGMQYKDALKFRLQRDGIAAQSPQRMKKTSKVVIQKQSVRQTISVGVCGALHRIGTTKQALHITKFLCENGYSACYIENNGHGHMDAMADYYEVSDHGEYLTYGEIDIFKRFDMAAILQGGYEFLVYDNGLFDETDKQKFLAFDIKIVCIGATAWEAPCVNSVFAEIGDFDNIHFIFSFVPEDMERDLLTLMAKFKNRTYFAKYAPQLVDGLANRGIYQRIFADYVHEGIGAKKEKKGLWPKR